MLSNRALAFLQQHKRRRHVSDLDFVARLFRQVGISTVTHLLDFQETFGGYVSPTHRGQFVWELTTATVPPVQEHSGLWITACCDDPTHGPRIDTNGCLYTVRMSPIASSCFLFFEQLGADLAMAREDRYGRRAEGSSERGEPIPKRRLARCCDGSRR